MGQMKAYAEWAKDEGYLDSDYMPVDPEADSMDYTDKFIKARASARNLNMASSHFTNLINIFKFKISNILRNIVHYGQVAVFNNTKVVWRKIDIIVRQFF